MNHWRGESKGKGLPRAGIARRPGAMLRSIDPGGDGDEVDALERVERSFGIAPLFVQLLREESGADWREVGEEARLLRRRFPSF
jgi:hypothetical protein